MGVQLSHEEIIALHASLHRLAQVLVPGCTEKHVEQAAKVFHDRNATRLDNALRLYWQLSEGRYDLYPAANFLEQLRARVAETPQIVEQFVVSYRDFWKDES